MAAGALFLVACSPAARTPAHRRSAPSPQASLSPAPGGAIVSPGAPAVSPADPPSSVPAAVPEGAPSPSAAVTALIPPRSGTTSACYAAGTRAFSDAGCPVTSRLRARLMNNPMAAGGGGAQPICRCQNANPGAAPAPAAVGGGTATVTVDFGFPSNPNVVRFSVLDVAGGWLVDDTDCGDASSSIYGSPVKTCFS
jgi:hypothetical protein